MLVLWRVLGGSARIALKEESMVETMVESMGVSSMDTLVVEQEYAELVDAKVEALVVVVGYCSIGVSLLEH